MTEKCMKEEMMGRKAVIFTFFVILMLALSASIASANVIYVDAASPLGGDGQTWGTAYKYLQDALAASGYGDEVWVAQGTYKPDQDESGNVTPGDRSATFSLVNGVSVFGGFPYGGGTWESRDVDLYETILSGDLLGDDVEVSVGESLGDEPTRAENSDHIVTALGCDSDTVLDGFTITGGHVPYSPTNCGGTLCYGAGMSLSNCEATVENCRFTANYALYGGAISNDEDGWPTFLDCTFVGNGAERGGGAIGNDGGNATMTNCTFSSNSGGGYHGGAINFVYGTCVLTNCTFTQNSAERHGGAIKGYYSATIMLTDCAFTGNSAMEGGAFFGYEGNVSMTNCTFYDNRAFLGIGIYDGTGGAVAAEGEKLVLNNCIFSGNRAASQGGGAYLDQCEVVLTNCTIVGNSADITRFDQYGDGLYLVGGRSNASMTNCIFWGNKHEQVSRLAGALNMTYSCIEGGYPGVGNTDANPFFVDTGFRDDSGTPGDPTDDFWVDGDYHLLPWSPCIDTADNTVVDSNYPDLDGNARIMDGDGDGVAVVDMGAYEFFYPNRPPIADAGQDQIFFTYAGGMVEVKLDGSGSYDDDGEELEYFWFEDDEQIATGVDPNVQLGVGEHKIELIVSDGQEDSEPDDVTIAIVGIEEPGLYYDVTFSSPEHIAGLPPSVGYFSTRPTKIVFGEPLVEPSLGTLSGQPLVFNTTGNNSPFYYDQIRFVVGQEQDYYYVSFDVLLQNLIASTNRFTVLFDTPTVRNLYFKNDGTIYIENWNNHTRRGESKVIGTFTENEDLYVEVKMNLVLQEWEILLNGDRLHIGLFEPDEDIEAIRFNLGLSNSSHTPNHDTYVGLDNIIVANRDMSESQPVADAGREQMVFACAGGLAEVKLDGSGSYDADGDELDYFWFIGDEQIATGVDPNVQLSVGEHIIELIVNDGSEDSEPNAVVITVIGPVEADVHIVPRVINRNNRMKRVMAIIRLPAGIKKDDVVPESFELYAGGLDGEPVGAILERVIGRGNMTRVFVLFDKDEVMSIVEGVVGGVELTVVGRLESGQYIQGSDTVRIVKPRRRRPHWQAGKRRRWKR
jgi:predicted outer membrane repeat protein